MQKKKPLIVCGKGDPLHVAPTASLWRERRSFSRASGLFIHLYVPKKEHSHEMWGKQSPSTEPHVYRRPMYKGVRPGSPSGSLTTLPQHCLQHVTFHLGLGRPQPR